MNRVVKTRIRLNDVMSSKL